MKTFTDSTMMPFGRYGPGMGDPRALGDVPEAYLQWLSQQDWMYGHRELGEYIEAKLQQARPAPIIKKPAASSRGPRMKSSFKELLKTL